jgi:hypothetical protein
MTNREGLWRNNISPESPGFSGRFPFATVGNSSSKDIEDKLVDLTGVRSILSQNKHVAQSLRFKPQWPPCSQRALRARWPHTSTSPRNTTLLTHQSSIGAMMKEGSAKIEKTADSHLIFRAGFLLPE